MTNTELQRHELRNKLAEVLGDAAMETLMGHLPPSGWADVARKDDIDAVSEHVNAVRQNVKDEIALLRRDMAQLEERLEMKFDIRIEQLRTEMYKAMNRQLMVFTSVQFTLTTLLAGVILKFG